MDALRLLDRSADFRDAPVTIPQKPVSLPYELRTEMTWMDFCHPVNPLGTPKSIVAAMHTALVDGELAFTPDRDAHVLRDAIARRLGLDSGCVLVGASVAGMIRSVAQAYTCGTVGIVCPSPSDYALAIDNAGHEYVELVNDVSFAPIDAYTARGLFGELDGVVLGNPTYPTSRLLPKSTLIHYLETCGWVIVDESNIELSFGGESMVPLVARYSNLIVIRDISTTYSMPGVPMSYAVASPSTISQIRRFYDGADVSMFAEVLAPELVRQQEYLEDTHEFLDKEIPWMQCMLALIPGIQIYPAEGNFVLCEFVPGADQRLGVISTEELVIRLQLAGFLVRPLKEVAGLLSNDYFCVCVKTREENQKLLDAMRNIISRGE